MAFRAPCPSCGAPVDFKSAVSFHAVCEFCRSTLVRHGEALENLGRMAELLADGSALQLGSEGRYRGAHFVLVGRIQLKYADGLWSEWHLLFDNGRSGWLSDANGEYLLSFLTPPAGEIPPFAALAPDQAVSLAGRHWQVSNIEEALCIAGEGELPFAFGAGYPAQLADLRDTDGAFASIDYSETPPLLFVGESVSAEALQLTRQRESPAGSATKSAGPVELLSCPACGGAIHIHDDAIQSVACPSCLALLSADNRRLAVLQKVAAAMRLQPLIALGSVGRFRGVDWTLIGFQQRVITSDGIEYPWQEYLLHHPGEGFRWLIENTGHWSWVTPLRKAIAYSTGAAAVMHEGVSFIRFSEGLATTRYVIGEFNWKVKLGETWDTLDLIAPPRMLSSERQAKETVWSLGEYLTPDDVSTAFSLPGALAKARGIGVIEPNPQRAAHQKICRRFWQAALCAVLLHLVWLLLGGKTLLDTRLVYAPDKTGSITTPSFRIDQKAKSLVLRHDTNLDNNWIGLDIALVEKTHGQAWHAETELSYWQGIDGSESWSEGERQRDLVFHDVAAGDYYLVIEPEMSTENRAAVVDRLRIVNTPAHWSNLVFVLIFLAVFPLVSRHRVASAESARWAQADFSPRGTELTPEETDPAGDDD